MIKEFQITHIIKKLPVVYNVSTWLIPLSYTCIMLLLLTNQTLRAAKGFLSKN